MYKHLLSLSFLVAILQLVGAACSSSRPVTLTFSISTSPPPATNPSGQTVTIKLTSMNNNTNFNTTLTPTLDANGSATASVSGPAPTTTDSISYTVVPPAGFQLVSNAPASPITIAPTDAGTTKPVTVQLSPQTQQPPTTTVTFTVMSSVKAAPIPPTKDPLDPTPSPTTVTVTLVSTDGNPMLNTSMSSTTVPSTGPNAGIVTIAFPNLPTGASYTYSASADGFDSSTPVPAKTGDIDSFPISLAPSQVEYTFLTGTMGQQPPNGGAPPVTATPAEITITLDSNPSTQIADFSTGPGTDPTGQYSSGKTTLMPGTTYDLTVKVNQVQQQVTPTSFTPTVLGQSPNTLTFTFPSPTGQPIPVTFNTFFKNASVPQTGISASITFNDSRGNPVTDSSGNPVTVTTVQVPNDKTIDSGTASFLPGAYTYLATATGNKTLPATPFTVPNTSNVVNIDFSSLFPAVVKKALPPPR